MPPPQRIDLDLGEIEPRWWVKVVEFLQQNWALPIPNAEGGVTVLFAGDTGRVFDRLSFSTEMEMVNALTRNGFEDFYATASLQAFLRPPAFPLTEGSPPNGPIYSSGRFWRS